MTRTSAPGSRGALGLVAAGIAVAASCVLPSYQVGGRGGTSGSGGAGAAATPTTTHATTGATRSSAIVSTGATVTSTGGGNGGSGGAGGGSGGTGGSGGSSMPGSLEWAFAVSAPTVGTVVPTGLAVDPSGFIFVSGWFTGMGVSFGGQTINAIETDLFALELDPAGKLVWLRVVNGPGNEIPLDLRSDGSGHLFLAGTFDKAFNPGCAGGLTATPVGPSENFVLALDAATGTCTGLVTFGSPMANVGATLDVRGTGLRVASWYPTANDGLDFAVYRYDTAFNAVGPQSFLAPGDQTATALRYLTGGSYVVGGSVEGSMLLGGGHTITAVNGGKDLYLAAFDASDSPLWTAVAGGPHDDSALALAATPGGGVVVGGILTTNTAESVVAQYDALGASVWLQTYGNSPFDAANGVAVRGDGKVFATGAFGSATNFGIGTLTPVIIDAYVLELEPKKGNTLWQLGLGDVPGKTGRQIGRLVAVDQLGAVLVAGTFDGNIQLGPGAALHGTGQRSLFVAKLVKPD